MYLNCFKCFVLSRKLVIFTKTGWIRLIKNSVRNIVIKIKTYLILPHGSCTWANTVIPIITLLIGNYD